MKTGLLSQRHVAVTVQWMGTTSSELGLLRSADPPRAPTVRAQTGWFGAQAGVAAYFACEHTHSRIISQYLCNRQL